MAELVTSLYHHHGLDSNLCSGEISSVLRWGKKQKIKMFHPEEDIANVKVAVSETDIIYHPVDT